MGQHEHTAFLEADPVVNRPEIGGAAQAPEVAGFQVADAPRDRPAAGEECGYWGQKPGSMI